MRAVDLERLEPASIAQPADACGDAWRVETGVATSNPRPLASNPRTLASYPRTLRNLMADLGPVWGRDMRRHRNQVWEAFEPLLRDAPSGGVDRIRDLPYGEHPRQVLDVYRPAAASGKRPIVVFVHGGAFVRGERDISAYAYANVLTWFARQGYLGVNMEYRLAPEAPYPAGADDVAGAVSWLQRHAAEHGGDPAQIFLVGHSSGGTHVATYVYDRAAGHVGKGVRGAVLLSARLRADRRPENPNAAGVEAYFGTDDALLEQRSPVTHAHASAVSTLIVVAQYENPLLDVYGTEMLHRLAAAQGHAPPFLWLAGHNHISLVAHFNTGEEILGREILAFFDSINRS
jgi:acetyl esterase/lipase